ncbi:MAG: recombinase family protein, partial [Rhodoferax sp.]|uniref:recombinase family protein n=1 Tax=Rhodoferax sp. TaxID=50421 RepID=UPI00179D6C0B
MQNKQSHRWDPVTPVLGSTESATVKSNPSTSTPENRGQGMRVAVYARYSDDKQKATSIDDQIHMCRETAERMDYVVCDALIFNDDAISGQGKKTHKRTRYLALRDAIRAGEVDVLICDQQCRLARSAKEALDFLDDMSKHNVRLLTADGFDSHEKTARLVFSIKSVFSEFFIDETRHRVFRSMNGEFDRGSMVTAIPYGYEIDVVRSNVTGQCIWSINEDEATVVRELFRHRKNGMSLSQIAAILNGRGVPTSRQEGHEKKLYWRASAIWRLLENPMYKGLYQVNFGRDKLEERRTAQRLMTDLALVSEYEWNVVQEMGKRSPPVAEKLIAQGTKGQRGAYGGGKHPFTGVFRCGTCGVYLSCHHPRSNAGTLHCIQCEHATNVGVPGRQPLYLSMKGVHVMLRWLLQQVLSADVVSRYRAVLKERLVGGREAELEAAKQDLGKAERSQARLARLLQQIEADDPVLEEQYRKTRTEVLELKHKLHELETGLRDLNVEAIRRQLDIDLSAVVDQFLADAIAPELSVITQFDGPMFTIGDGQSGQYIQGQQNGTSIATGAVLV